MKPHRITKLLSNHILQLHCILLFLLCTTIARAQETLKPPNPDPPKLAEVSKWKPIYLNEKRDSLATTFISDSTADGYILSGQFKRIVMIRFRYQSDLQKGLQQAIDQEGIKNGVILTGIGSVTRYHIHSVDNNTFPSKNTYTEKEESSDIVSINGFIIDGKLHAHIALANEVSSPGGHLEQGTKVFTFAGIAIGVLDEKTKLKHLDNKNWK